MQQPSARLSQERLVRPGGPDRQACILTKIRECLPPGVDVLGFETCFVEETLQGDGCLLYTSDAADE